MVTPYGRARSSSGRLRLLQPRHSPVTRGLDHRRPQAPENILQRLDVTSRTAAVARVFPTTPL